MSWRFHVLISARMAWALGGRMWDMRFTATQRLPESFIHRCGILAEELVGSVDTPFPIATKSRLEASSTTPGYGCMDVFYFQIESLRSEEIR
ncbi:uncharacterized protein EI97DRAFT_60139 [Westerdykella ornata]|uniref:Secreted protein n=1 Tax=Westerdykella ornata TaxID=318751 RepID=A0A6A6JHN2_WESOR|nr:uncharacterized protein EI97DRAFT_60139 [Westerdykella ornata]KAF2275897.1 hypothetical protein EI97DRAFT_60139 [Westerdykella ornata]